MPMITKPAKTNFSKKTATIVEKFYQLQINIEIINFETGFIKHLLRFS